jgi:serine/threonine-protein kinase
MMGSQISHYRLERKLGAGTFGEVYEGVHVHDGELRVAVKVVSPSLVQDARFVDALKQECRQLDKLDHANIVRFRDLVVGEGRVAMVLELLSGQDLHARLAGGALPVETTVSLLESMLEGLGYAHARGVLHRDIKPGNVFWCDDGRVKLLDFGIARAADGAQATKTGHMVGTFDYMAPERFEGQHGSASSDVYAMGLIAWEMLTGRVACPEGEPGRKMKWHLMTGVGTGGTVASTIPGCPAWLAEVVATLASTEVSARPVDGNAALSLLREKRARAASGGAASSRRPPPGTVAGPVAVRPPPSGSSPPSGRSAPPGTVLGPGSLSPGAASAQPEGQAASGSEPPSRPSPSLGADAAVASERSKGGGSKMVVGAAVGVLAVASGVLVVLGALGAGAVFALGDSNPDAPAAVSGDPASPEPGPASPGVGVGYLRGVSWDSGGSGG